MRAAKFTIQTALLLPAALSPRHALAGPIPVFSCFSADSESSIPSLTISNNTHSLLPATHFAPGVLQLCFTDPESRGGRSAEKRSGARRNTRWACHLASKTRVNALMTRHTRRLRGALRPMTRDARLSALHRGGFGPRVRASLTGICAGSVTASSSHPGRSAWRAGSRASRGERLRAAAARRHASLRLQVASGGRPQ